MNWKHKLCISIKNHSFVCRNKRFHRWFQTFHRPCTFFYHILRGFRNGLANIRFLFFLSWRLMQLLYFFFVFIWHSKSIIHVDVTHWILANLTLFKSKSIASTVMKIEQVSFTFKRIKNNVWVNFVSLNNNYTTSCG